VVMILIVMIQLSNCSPKKSEEKKQIQIAMPTWIGYAPLLVADELKIDLKYGFDLKLERIDNVQAIINAITAGKLDGVCTTIDAAVKARASGVPIKIVMAFDTSTGGDGLVTSGEIKGIEDLKGKKVALQIGSPSHFLFLNIIDKSGLTPDDVKIIPMEPGDAGAAFVAGKIEAAVTWEPWLSRASERVGGHLVATSADYPGLIVDILALSESFLKENPQLVKKVCLTWFEALDILKNDRNKALEIMAKGLGVPAADVEAMMGGITFYGRQENRDFFLATVQQQTGKETAMSVAEKANNFWQTLKLIEKPVPSTEIVITSFIDDALKNE
jgi:NitT/TauT family transport system substrate-binding protein